MNRKYRFYYRSALRQSCKAIIGNKGHFNYYFYLILEYLAKFTLIFAPLFELSKIAFAKEIKNNGKADPLKALSSSNKFKSYWAIMLSYVLQGLIFVAGLIMCALLIALLGIVGYAVSSLSARIQPATCAILFAIPGFIATILYCIAFPILFAPVTYVIETNPDIGYGKAVAVSFKAMKEKGFFTYLACLIWPTMINVAFVFCKSIILVILVLIARLLGDFGVFFLIVSLLILASELLYFLPIYDLTTKVAHVWLFDDIVETEEEKAVVQTTRGVYVKDFKSDRVGINNIKNNLIRLFDSTDDLENEIEEETVVNTVVETKVEEKIEEVKEETTEEVVEATNEETQEVSEAKEEVVEAEEKAAEEATEEVVEENKSANTEQEEVEVQATEEDKQEEALPEEVTTKKSRRAKKEEKAPKEKKERKSLFKKSKGKVEETTPEQQEETSVVEEEKVETVEPTEEVVEATNEETQEVNEVVEEPKQEELTQEVAEEEKVEAQVTEEEASPEEVKEEATEEVKEKLVEEDTSAQ